MSAQNKTNPHGGASGSDQKMNFMGHLDELRTRAYRGVWVFFLGFMGCFVFAEKILKVLRQPLFNVLPPEQQKLYFTSLFENFMTHLKVSGYATFVFLSPYFFFEVWRFVSPGLYPKEKKWIIPFFALATLFFIGGACFAYFVVFPVGFKYFMTFGGPQDQPLLTIESYYTTVLKLLALFGLAFEFPVIVTLFGVLGLVNSSQLREKRRIAIVGVAIFSAIAAPPDAVSMLLMMAPLLLFYEIAILAVAQWEKYKGLPVARPSEEKNKPNESEAPKHPWTGESS